MEAAAEAPPKRGRSSLGNEPEKKLARTLDDLSIDDEVITLFDIKDFSCYEPNANEKKLIIWIDNPLILRGLSKEAKSKIGSRKFKLIIPKQIYRLEERCFYNYNNLVSVTFEESRNIPNFAFVNCHNLSDVIITTNVGKIIVGNKAFKNCYKLVNFPFKYIEHLEGNENFFNCLLPEIDLSDSSFFYLTKFCFAFNMNNIPPRNIYFPKNHDKRIIFESDDPFNYLITVPDLQSSLDSRQLSYKLPFEDVQYDNVAFDTDINVLSLPMNFTEE